LKTIDLCLKCPRQTKLQRTPEDKKFCVYCKTRRDILDQNGKFVDGYIFESDFAMGLYTRLQHWTSKPFVCPTCGSADYKLEVETHDPPKEGIFQSVPVQRLVVVCVNGHRIYPDDTMRTHDFKV
jgi:hypothetical protein